MKEGYLGTGARLVFRKGDTSLASNCRPISLTSIFCKMLQFAVTMNVVSHMDKYNLLYNRQQDFHSKSSLELRLVSSAILEHTNNNTSCI